MKLFAVAATTEPTRKKASARMTRGLRPKMWLKLAKEGWKTVEVSRNDVPAQKASMAVPCSFCAMTGSATDMLVPSRATMRVRTARERKASQNRRPGRKSA